MKLTRVCTCVICTRLQALSSFFFFFFLQEDNAVSGEEGHSEAKRRTTKPQRRPDLRATFQVTQIPELPGVSEPLRAPPLWQTLAG